MSRFKDTDWEPYIVGKSPVDVDLRFQLLSVIDNEIIANRKCNEEYFILQAEMERRARKFFPSMTLEDVLLQFEEWKEEQS